MGKLLGHLILFSIALFVTAGIGHIIYGSLGALAFSIGLSIVVFIVHACSANKIMTWLDNFTLENIPNVSGWWDKLAAKLFRVLKVQQRQQQALLSALGSFRTAAQALPDGVITLNKAGNIIWCNAMAQQLFGLNLNTDIGFALNNIVRVPQFSQYLQNENWEQPLKMRSPRSNAKTLSAQAVRYADNLTLILIRDITTLEKLESIRRDFIANVSHELKTPLTVLSGFLETFQTMPLSESQRNEYLQLMHSQAQRMQNLVEDLLTLSALESQSPSKVENPVDITALALEAIKDGEQLSNGQHKIIHTIPSESIFVQGNTSELRSAFTNIVSNAVRYTPENGEIHIAMTTSKNHLDQGVVLFSVKDSGIGIPQSHIPRLTERFYRIDRGRSRESGGTGLGLAIVKHVLSRHNGKLLIQSTPQVGSTFTIELPYLKNSNVKI